MPLATVDMPTWRTFTLKDMPWYSATVKRLMIIGLSSFLVIGCGGGEEAVDDPCGPLDTIEVLLGSGVGGEFSQFADGEEVGLVVAPQGGFGVQTVIRTSGLIAGEGATADALLEVEVEGQNAGSFLLEGSPLQCAEGVGGQIFGQVVGFDSDLYRSNDDLLALDGSTVILDVTVTDDAGMSGNVRQPVVVRVGG